MMRAKGVRGETIQEAVVPWLSYVRDFVRAYEHGESLSGTPLLRQKSNDCSIDLQEGEMPRKPVTVLLCSPHPDDEVLTGVLPLRLLQEQGAQVVNLAVTLGSNVARQEARWEELLEACAVLGFDCLQFQQPEGFDLKAVESGEGWLAGVEWLVGFFAQLNPSFVFLPHAHDAHPAHIATHRLVVAALALWTGTCPVTVKAVETEYWSSMTAPNLLVGVSCRDLARLLAGLSCHRGELARNPYHLTHPARLMDTVRRGAEQITSVRPARPDFLFAELYRLSVWQHGQSQAYTLWNACLGPNQGLNEIVAIG
ncbi:MAG: PIG-L family deacetylase [Desulfobulbaceae bacterium]|nr:PIG-L family deacetylase [Desulfobulbaceae bacterium]